MLLCRALTPRAANEWSSYSTLVVNGGNPRLRVLPVYMKFTHPWCEAFPGGTFLLPTAWNIPERNLHWMCDASLAAYRHQRHCRSEGQRGTGLIPRVHTQWRWTNSSTAVPSSQWTLPLSQSSTISTGGKTMFPKCCKFQVSLIYNAGSGIF